MCRVRGRIERHPYDGCMRHGATLPSQERAFSPQKQANGLSL